MGPSSGSPGLGLQPLRMLLQDGRLVDLAASATTDSLGKDLDARTAELEAGKSLETCSVSDEENPDSFSVSKKFVMFSSFLCSGGV